MKKSEFKNLVKPIIEECLKEMIIKEAIWISPIKFREAFKLLSP